MNENINQKLPWIRRFSTDVLKIFQQLDIAIPTVLYFWHKFTLQSTKLKISVDDSRYV